MAQAPFVIVPSLTAIAVAYTQAELIADKVFPRVPVWTEAFLYQKYNLGDAFQNPDTRVGRKSAPNQIDWGSSQLTDQTEDHGLDVLVPNKDITAWEQAQALGGGHVSQADPLSRNTMLVTQAVQNRREYRAANLAFNAASYGTNNKVLLSGTSQWSDFTNSDPLVAILGYLDTMIMRPNVGVVGQLVATKLMTHPKVCKAIFGNNTDAGVAPLDNLAKLLGLEELIVGGGWINTAQPGQAPNIQRCWGKHAAFFNRNKSADTKAGITFGLTAQYGDKVAGVIQDGDVGLLGGQRVRSGEMVKELITANDLGFFVQNAVA